MENEEMRGFEFCPNVLQVGRDGKENVGAVSWR
jgi:hypothetical protein